MKAPLTLPVGSERNTIVEVLNEVHVLARYAERVAQIEARRQRTRIVDALRAQRRAERATARARRLMAMAGLE